MRFGIVGVTAASVHFSLVIFFVELYALKPLQANVIAFLIAFQVSYWGHRYWTFRGTTNSHRVALPRLFVICGSSFIANEGLYYLVLTYLKLPYPLALLVVFAILPLVNFTFEKFWVFQN